MKRKYNGKEYQNAFNLNWLDYGAINYDPQLARWLQIDPADEFNSPYVYVGNDPIIFVDPDGSEESPIAELGFDWWLENTKGKFIDLGEKGALLDGVEKVFYKIILNKNILSKANAIKES